MSNYVSIAEKIVQSPNFIACAILISIVSTYYIYCKNQKKENKDHDYITCPNTCIIKDLLLKYEHLEKIKLDKETFDKYLEKMEKLIESNIELKTSMSYVSKTIDEIKEFMIKKVR